MTNNGNFECGKCPSHWQNVLIIFVSCLITVIAVILIIKVTFSAIDNKNNSCSIYLKMMVNHLQLIYLVSTFDLSWPQEVNPLNLRFKHFKKVLNLLPISHNELSLLIALLRRQV